MAGISGVGSVSNDAFQAQYNIRVLKLGNDVVSQQGKEALQLIQAASIDTGQNLNVTA